MGDLREDFQAMREERKARHKRNMIENSLKLGEARAKGLLPPWIYQPKGECFLFRTPGWPIVDFYPYTGRWRTKRGIEKTHGIGIDAFITWMNKRRSHHG